MIAVRPPADAAEPQHLLERRLDLPVDDRRPVVVVRREHASRPENARRFGERRLGLHPVQRLRAGDDVRRAVRKAGRLRVRPGRSGRSRPTWPPLPARASPGSPRRRSPRRRARPTAWSRDPFRCRDRPRPSAVQFVLPGTTDRRARRAARADLRRNPRRNRCFRTPKTGGAVRSTDRSAPANPPSRPRLSLE